eukprot:5138472-Pyramimonas_sp.AAC.1
MSKRDVAEGLERVLPDVVDVAGRRRAAPEGGPDALGLGLILPLRDKLAVVVMREGVPDRVAAGLQDGVPQ